MPNTTTIKLIDEFRKMFNAADLDTHTRKKYLQLCDVLEDLDCQHRTHVDIPDGTRLNILETARQLQQTIPPHERGSRRVRAIDVTDAILSQLETLY